jgi:hypothetical protein
MAVLRLAVLLFFSKLPSSLPILEALRFYEVALDECHVRMFPHCPYLRTVEIHHCAVQTLKNEDCLLVSNLSIATEVASFTFDVIVLNDFRNIRQLMLATRWYAQVSLNPDLDDPTPDEVLLPRLQRLRLRGCIPAQVVECLVAPLLKELEVDSYPTLNILRDLPLTRPLETIRIATPKVNQSSVSRAVEDLLNSAPAVKQLCVPQWCHDLLKLLDAHLDDILVIIEEQFTDGD